MLEQLARAPSRQLTRRPEARPDLTGRRSGTRYAAVNYLLLGREVLITTDSSWWHNLDVGPLAELRPRGRTLRPTSEVIRDHDLVAYAERPQDVAEQ